MRKVSQTGEDSTFCRQEIALQTVYTVGYYRRRLCNKLYNQHMYSLTKPP